MKKIPGLIAGCLVLLSGCLTIEIRERSPYNKKERELIRGWSAQLGERKLTPSGFVSLIDSLNNHKNK